MTATVFFTLDIDPSFPWRSDIKGLKEFLSCLEKARYHLDFVCEMNITGFALVQIANVSQKLINKLKELVAADIVEIGNHGYTHRPLGMIETKFRLTRYIKGKKLAKHVRTVIFQRQMTDNIRITFRHAINLFLTKPDVFEKKEIIKEIRVTNKLLERVFGHPPQIFRAPFFCTSKLISTVIRKEGIKYDLSNYTKGSRLQAIVPRYISEEEGGIWEIDTTAKLDPCDWVEEIATYKPNLLPKGLTVIVTHPWEFSLANTQAKIVRKRFQQLLKETDNFVFVEDIIK